ncbi:hypothetical protein Tco_0789538 [Tanacetum coccineum]
MHEITGCACTEITNPEALPPKISHEKIPKTVDKMMQWWRIFLQGKKAASNQERKKALLDLETPGKGS